MTSKVVLRYRGAAAAEPPLQHHNINPPTSTRDMSTEPDPILAAIAAINAREPGDRLSYPAAVKILGCDKETLRRRHQNKQHTNAEAHKDAMLLNPQQDLELVQYIQGLSEHWLAPTRNMIQNFASEVAKWEVSMAGVERFLRRNRDRLSSKYTTGIDRNCFKADTECNGLSPRSYD
jgi:hypothetical protein